MRQLVEYIEALGLTLERFQFDGGQTWVIKGRGLPVWRGSYEWGEERHFENRLRAALDAIPWPTDDDPRVQGEY